MLHCSASSLWALSPNPLFWRFWVTLDSLTFLAINKVKVTTPVSGEINFSSALLFKSVCCPCGVSAPQLLPTDCSMASDIFLGYHLCCTYWKLLTKQVIYKSAFVFASYAVCSLVFYSSEDKKIWFYSVLAPKNGKSFCRYARFKSDISTCLERWSW